MKKFAVSLSVVFLAFALSACAAFQPEPTPTATPLPPTATPKPPTATPAPTLTPTRTPRPDVEGLGERIEMPASGFSLQPPVDYDIQQSVLRCRQKKIFQALSPVLSLTVGEFVFLESLSEHLRKF